MGNNSEKNKQKNFFGFVPPNLLLNLDSPRIPSKRLILILSFLAILFFISYADRGLIIYDEGVLYSLADAIYHGQILHKDVICCYPPGSFFLTASFFKFFGRELLPVRFFLASLRGICLVFIFILARRLTPPIWAWIPALIFAIAPGPLHKIFFVFLAAAGLLGLQSLSLGNFINSNWKIFSWGIFVGICFFFRLDLFFVISLLTGLIMIIFYKKLGWRKMLFKLIIWALGVMFVFCIGGILLAFKGILKLSLQQIFSLPLIVSKHTELLKITPWQISNFNSIFWFFIVQSIAVIFYSFLLAKNINKAVAPQATNEKLKIISNLSVLFTILILSQYFHTPDAAHLFQIMPFLTIIAVFFLFQFSKSHNMILAFFGKLGVFWSVLFILWLAFYCSNAGLYTGSWFSLRNENTRLNIAGASLKINSSLAQNLEAVVNYIKENTAEDEPIYQIFYQPIFYFLTNRINPTRYLVVEPGFGDKPNQQQEIINDLKLSKVRCIIYQDNSIFGSDKTKPGNLTPEICQYVVQNFRREAQYGPFVIYKR